MTNTNNTITESEPHAFLVRPPSNEPMQEDDPCWGSADQNDLAALTKILDKSKCVLYESEDYVAIDKPCDLRMDGRYRSTVHKLTTYWYPSPLLLAQQPNLLQAVECLHRHNYLKDNELRPIHQLDYPTSGVLLVGRNKKATAVACNSFRKRLAAKTYLAIVHGHLVPDKAWPSLDQARLETMAESERVYKKTRNPNFKHTGETFHGFLPPNSAFMKWQSLRKQKVKSSEATIVETDMELEKKTKAIRFLKKRRLEKKERNGTVLEPREFQQVVDECVRLSEEDQQQLLDIKWVGVKANSEWSSTFKTLADRYNAVLKAKNGATSLEPLPRLFRVHGEEEEAFYIHAACAQIKERYKMTLHPDGMPFDTTLLPPKDQIDALDFKPALTRCIVIGKGYLNGHPVTKVQLEPRTGRRHQLRLHMVVAGCPIVGDVSYEHSSNPEKICPRMCLHAYKLSIRLIGGRRDIVSPDPFVQVDSNDDDNTYFLAKISGKN